MTNLILRIESAVLTQLRNFNQKKKKQNMKFFKTYIMLLIAFMLWITSMNYCFDAFINREVNVFLQIGVLGAMGLASYFLAYYVVNQIKKHKND